MKILDMFRREATPEAPLPGVVPPSRAPLSENVMSLSAVFRAVVLIATGVKQLTFDVRRYDEGVDSTLANRPDPNMSRSAFLELTVVSLALKGNAFWLVTRNSRNEAVACQVVDALEVTVHSDGRWASYKGKDYSLRPGGDMVHLQYLRIPGRLTGLGPIQAARAELEGSLRVRDYGSNFMESSEQPTGLLKSDQPLTAEAANRWRTQWMEQRKARQVAVLGSGLSYDPLMVSPRDAQFIETQNFNTTGIARLFGIPPRLALAILEGGSDTYSNMQQEDLSFSRWTLATYTREIEEALSWLLPGAQEARFNLDAFLRPDTKSRYDAHKVALDAGWKTINEVRAEEKMQGIAGGDVLRSPKVAAPAPADAEPESESK